MATINRDYSWMTCPCGEEFQVLKKVDDGSESGRIIFDVEDTDVIFYEHWNTACIVNGGEIPTPAEPTPEPTPEPTK